LGEKRGEPRRGDGGRRGTHRRGGGKGKGMTGVREGGRRAKKGGGPPEKKRKKNLGGKDTARKEEGDGEKGGASKTERKERVVKVTFQKGKTVPNKGPGALGKRVQTGNCQKGWGGAKGGAKAGCKHARVPEGTAKTGETTGIKFRALRWMSGEGKACVKKGGES